jgi:uncharacterized protein DUF5666
MRRVSVLGVSLLAMAVVTWPRPLAAQDKTARGTVTAMAGDSLTVRVGASDMKFTVDQKTTLVASGAGTQARKAEGAVKLGDFVKTGQAVVVSYRETGSTMYATRVEAVSTAGPGGGSVSSPASPAPPTKSSNGTVKSVAAGSLTITAGGKDMTFVVDGSTSLIAKGAGTKGAASGGKVAITDIVKAGERVSVSYHETGATMHAAEVRVLQ